MIIMNHGVRSGLLPRASRSNTRSISIQIKKQSLSCFKEEVVPFWQRNGRRQQQQQEDKPRFQPHPKSNDFLRLDQGLLNETTTTSLATLASLLKRCGQAKALCEGKLVHNHIKKCNLEKNTFLGNWLVKMYGDCGSMEDAKSVFDNLPNLNPHSWTMLVNAYAKNGFSRQALECFDRMQVHGFKPNDVSFVCALDACSSLGALEKGQEIHAAIVDCGYEEKVIVGTALVDMYGKCGSLEDARHVFRQMRHRNVVSWSAMIAACSKNGHCKEALDLFEQMQSHGVKPDRVTFLSALDACAGLAALEKGKGIHKAITEAGYEGQMLVSTALINMYGKCGSLEDARSLFIQMNYRDVVSWNAMIGACAQNGHGKEALDLFDRMQSSGVRPDQVTFICALEACDSPDALEKGREIHAAICGRDFEGEVSLGTSLVDMYGKCGSVEDAWNVFDQMLDRNVVSWNAMITACNQNGQSKEALELISDMERCGFKPDQFTLVCGLEACSNLAFLKKGQEIHASIVKEQYEGDVVVGNALVNMYGKCGNLEDALSIFSQMPHRDVVSWNAMITACAQHGQGGKALDLFNAMQYEGFQPDIVTLLSVLAVCSHTGCVNVARQFLYSISHIHGITPKREHYVRLIDILSRAGHLHDAETLINNMSLGKLLDYGQA
ncbi:hypothetical protein O6H91_19G047300 [Diphasiastrum complanatum]|uniref:Uncharacterized protein n=1 Tax=Diphasiastrum complanatum TaxID=34168 RepID=A0ACC2AUT7_DIPCM|nr:hypothetical protein O6H91_19G047300 [Diphasiastrum complanatum]